MAAKFKSCSGRGFKRLVNIQSGVGLVTSYGWLDCPTCAQNGIELLNIHQRERVAAELKSCSGSSGRRFKMLVNIQSGGRPALAAPGLGLNF